MATYFLDSTTGDDEDDGSTMDLAWATLDYAVTTGATGADDVVWIRRIHAETPGSDIDTGGSIAAATPARFIGWPRNTHAVASSDWTNGSTTVTVDDDDMDREQHCSRYITAPDGEDYLITKVTDSGSIEIDREYVGSTAADQAATIKADDDYTEAQAIDDSGWTINKAAWNADADDMPCIDFGNAAFQVKLDTAGRWFKNIEFRDSTDPNGIIRCSYPNYFQGCLLFNDQDASVIKFHLGYHGMMERCVLEQTANNYCIQINEGAVYLKDVAVLGGSYGIGLIDAGSRVFCDNVNIGVERVCGTADVICNGPPANLVLGRDIKFGGDTAEVTFSDVHLTTSRLEIENYNKNLGAHKVIEYRGYYMKQAADGGGDAPNQRTGGASNVIEILFSESNSLRIQALYPTSRMQSPIFVHEFEASVISKSYRYYVQAMGAVAANDLYLVCEYVKTRDDDSEYTIVEQISDETISARSDTDDWSQFIEVTGIQPAVASKVRIKCYCAYYHATNKIFIDPKVVIS